MPKSTQPPPAPDPPSSIQLDTPRIAVPQSGPVPKVELPPVQVEVPNTGDVTGGLQNVLP